MNNIRILIATSVHLPNDARIMRQATTLSECGYKVFLLAPWSGFSPPRGCSAIYFTRRPGVCGRIFAHLKFLWYSIAFRWSSIHIHDFDLLPAAMLIRLSTFKPCIYDVHENYAEEVMVRSNIAEAVRVPLSHLVNFVEWLAVRILKNLIVVVPVQQRRFHRWGCRRISMVRNFAPAEFALNTKVSNDGAKFVLNVGSQSVDYGAMVLVEASAILYDRSVHIPIRAIDRFDGNVVLRDAVLGMACQRALDYQLIPRVPYQEIRRYLSCAEIGLSLISDTPNKRIAYPTKLFEYMACGIPIIATNVGYQAEIIHATGAGILIQPDDAKALADAIAKLWYDKELRNSLSIRGRKAFLKSYCWESEGAALLDCYRKCVQ